jgi:hypothetical protein
MKETRLKMACERIRANLFSHRLHKQTGLCRRHDFKTGLEKLIRVSGFL